MMSQNGRVVVVTGGAKGIGLSIVHEFASEGASVVIASRDGEAAHEAIRGMSDMRGSAIWIELDVRERWSVDSLFENVFGRFGQLDVLVNNSGVEHAEQLDGPTDADWDEMFSVNVRGAWLCMRASLPHLLKSRGRIVNIASMAGMLGVAGGAGYASSKAAMISLTKSFALAYAEAGISVNAICPGPILTDMTYEEWRRVGDEGLGRAQALAMCPARRIATADEVAALVAFVASAEASFVTGAVIPIDGAKTSGLMSPERYHR